MAQTARYYPDIQLDGGKIYRNINEAIGDAGWLLMTIKKQAVKGQFETKETLKNLANEWYNEQFEKDLIGSRHTLDTFLAKLEGAGFIQAREFGRARLYFITEQGEEYIEYMKILDELQSNT